MPVVLEVRRLRRTRPRLFPSEPRIYTITLGLHRRPRSSPLGMRYQSRCHVLDSKGRPPQRPHVAPWVRYDLRPATLVRTHSLPAQMCLFGGHPPPPLTSRALTSSQTPGQHTERSFPHHHSRGPEGLPHRARTCGFARRHLLRTRQEKSSPALGTPRVHPGHHVDRRHEARRRLVPSATSRCKNSPTRPHFRAHSVPQCSEFYDDEIGRIFLQFLHPRMDGPVSREDTHLLRSPFSVHSATGRIALPLHKDFVLDFNPCQAPTLNSVMQELDDAGLHSRASRGAGEWEHTSMGSHVQVMRTLTLQLEMDQYTQAPDAGEHIASFFFPPP